MSYRFDAVASISVHGGNGGGKTFEPALIHGDPLTLKAADVEIELFETEKSRSFAQMAVDTEGIVATLHILEGIGAEGKEWIKREHEREKTFMMLLADESDAHGQ